MNVTKTITTIAIASFLLFSSSALFAQGTATNPSTAHTLIFGPPHEVQIGSLTDPMPIDLDPNGGPWRKAISTAPGVSMLPGDILTVHETIENVGTEPWTDWHEDVLPAWSGGAPGMWISAELLINGIPAAATITGLGTTSLNFDPIVPSVQPGDVLEIWKDFQYTQAVESLNGQAVLEILEYPTPEPASAALLGLGAWVLLPRRRTSRVEA